MTTQESETVPSVVVEVPVDELTGANPPWAKVGRVHIVNETAVNLLVEFTFDSTLECRALVIREA